MKTVLTSGLNAQEAAEIVAAFRASAHLRERLSSIFLNKIESKRAAARSIDAYDSPGWAFMQADAVGYERALSEVISILSSKKE